MLLTRLLSRTRSQSWMLFLFLVSVVNVDDDSDSDDDKKESKPPAASKPPAKKDDSGSSSSSDSDSDDDDSDDDDSDDDDSDSSPDDADEKKDDAAGDHYTSPAGRSGEARGEKKPFQRVDITAVTFDKPELAAEAEAAGRYHEKSIEFLRSKGHTYADKAQEKLGSTKGASFRKAMTKAKRGTYRGGLLDTNQVNSIKF